MESKRKTFQMNELHSGRHAHFAKGDFAPLQVLKRRVSQTILFFVQGLGSVQILRSLAAPPFPFEACQAVGWLFHPPQMMATSTLSYATWVLQLSLRALTPCRVHVLQAIQTHPALQLHLSPPTLGSTELCGERTLPIVRSSWTPGPS